MNGYTIFFTITSKAKQVIDGLLLVCIWWPWPVRKYHGNGNVCVYLCRGFSRRID